MEESSRLIGSRYQLKQKVGQGAMGVVWQAYDEQLHRVVAAKELLALDGLDDARVDRAKARAMREARLAARLEHPNAIRVYDVVEEEDRPWLIMEYLPSRSLAAVIAEQGTLPPREVARIGCYTAAALAAAHRHGIQHRDVKPGNVLIGDQEVKITDFGISRATDDDGTATATGTVGTPAFFSPEVARGEDAGLPSDVFSLGATLYNAVEGGPPFGTADNNLVMLHRVAGGSIMPPANAGPLLSPVLFRLLATDPARRPTMQEAVHLLAAVVNETPLAAEATAVIPATVKLPVEAQPEEKAKQEAAAAAAGLVAGAAAVEAAGLTAPPAKPEPEPVAEVEAEPAASTAPEADIGTAQETPAAAPPVTPEPEPTTPEPQPAPPVTPKPTTPIRQTLVAGGAGVAASDPPAPVPPAEPDENRRKFPLVPIAIVLLVLAVGVGSFLLWPKGDKQNAQTPGSNGQSTSSTPSQNTGGQTTGQTEPQQPGNSQTQPPASSQTTPPENTPSQGQTPQPPAGPASAQEAITAYYAERPGNLEAGWATLTDNFKASRNQTFQTYQQFWNRFTSVRLSNVAPQGPNVVTVTLQYMQGDAIFTTETHTYTLVQQNGKWMIDNQA
ncbi:protein kinase domain-containing protein [Lentzea flaviverrucosa]|uniref:non-specific serine/threonine protein kinase n=1 Tax=Lentzea flaviverrucosa TaxID=200379 RepID=A0A1H9FHF1_9PSEU|nr:protein kinase [Lentzea flaviverrucosa]RDI35207.1 serine/threonine protein kinase [Lentzea flaviverrucosa]SEQ36748.1 Serine/threonine protein kinase [Lentzea flaviverrucosa]